MPSFTSKNWVGLVCLLFVIFCFCISICICVCVSTGAISQLGAGAQYFDASPHFSTICHKHLPFSSTFCKQIVNVTLSYTKLIIALIIWLCNFAVILQLILAEIFGSKFLVKS